METVNNIAAAASKVIWGEPQETTDAANATIVPETKGTEPISGELGDTKKGEPYDLGNADSTSTQNTLSSTTDGTASTFTPTDSTTLSPPGLAAKPLDSSSTVSPTPDSVSRTLAETHIAPLSSPDSSNPFDSTTSSSFKPTSEKPREIPLPSVPSTELPSSTTSATENKALDPAPLSSLTTEAPNPTGKPIESSKPSSTANAQGVPTDLQPLGSESSSEKQDAQGTGEKHIKSSGLVAEGGDFDAARPGAGREADRLLGKEGSAGAVGASGGSAVGSEEEHGEGKKEGKLTHLKEKIKEKLHKH
ncbi:putative glycine-rich cell wall structural protein 1 protein [Botrytis fragariae]|uniref:Putative glycine-rich cell wall structural protein 1 protein n=1 Tax=Botrytis fragariae TaxID=1964551 RepID=A0A8H6B143_9HELO|nr:putative glycine-rich cell wall structural protein 1 protein [Botrytis fragariae]KAF5877162.1 putative glycine-rich cell wall structural protein 1 protein [Botrytis fragariae]